MYKLIQNVKKIFICVKNTIYGLYMCLRKIGFSFLAFVVSLDEIFLPEKYFVYTFGMDFMYSFAFYRLLGVQTGFVYQKGQPLFDDFAGNALYNFSSSIRLALKSNIYAICWQFRAAIRRLFVCRARGKQTNNKQIYKQTNMHVHAQTAIRARRPLHNWAMNGINSKHLFILLLGSLDGFLSAPGTRHPAPVGDTRS